MGDVAARRGESLDSVSRGFGVEADRLDCRRETFLSAGENALNSRPCMPAEDELRRAKAKVGKLTMHPCRVVLAAGPLNEPDDAAAG